MPTPRETSIWGKIRKQLGDAQSMILNGRYAEAMILNKEILKTLVGMQVDRACLVTNTLEADIDQLFEGRYISKQTRDNYHSIRLYGEQAEAGNNPTAQAANDSFYLIKEELETYVDNNQRPAQPAETDVPEQAPRSRAAEIAGAAAGYQNTAEAQNAAGSGSGAGYQNTAGSQSGTGNAGYQTGAAGRQTPAGGRRPIGTDLNIPLGGRRQQSAGGSRPTRPLRSSERQRVHSGQRRPGDVRSGRNARGGSGRGEQPMELDLYSILKIAIPVACVILVIILIRVLTSGSKTQIATTAAATSAAVQQETQMVQETTMAPETTAAAAEKWVTTSGVRVRTAPNTTDSKVLDVLDAGTEVEFVQDAGEWIKINYKGQEAYINKSYVKAETAETAAETAAAGAAGGAADTAAGTANAATGIANAAAGTRTITAAASEAAAETAN